MESADPRCIGLLALGDAPEAPAPCRPGQGQALVQGQPGWGGRAATASLQSAAGLGGGGRAAAASARRLPLQVQADLRRAYLSLKRGVTRGATQDFGPSVLRNALRPGTEF